MMVFFFSSQHQATFELMRWSFDGAHTLHHQARAACGRCLLAQSVQGVDHHSVEVHWH